jgi:hypothetical protein
MEKSSIIKVLIILFGHLWEVELTYRYIFAFKFTLRYDLSSLILFALFATDVIDNGGKFAAGVADTGGKFPPVLTSASNFLPVSTTSETGGKICRRCC